MTSERIFGFYTSLLCRNFAMIAAVEPHPEDMQTLMKNLRGLTGNVVFVQKAVSEKDGCADFSFGGRTLGGDGREQFLVHQEDMHGLNIGEQIKPEKSKQ